jgi:hypothetical protein
VASRQPNEKRLIVSSRAVHNTSSARFSDGGLSVGDDPFLVFIEQRAVLVLRNVAINLGKQVIDW